MRSVTVMVMTACPGATEISCMPSDWVAASSFHIASAQARAGEIASPFQFDAAAGLARVALARGDTGAAMQALQPLLAAAANTVTKDKPLEGAEFPRVVEWTCHRVLASAGDPHAGEWLARAHEALQARAATIADAALREGFLRDIPVHAQIVAAWKAASAA